MNGLKNDLYDHKPKGASLRHISYCSTSVIKTNMKAFVISGINAGLYLNSAWKALCYKLKREIYKTNLLSFIPLGSLLSCFEKVKKLIAKKNGRENGIYSCYEEDNSGNP